MPVMADSESVLRRAEGQDRLRGRWTFCVVVPMLNEEMNAERCVAGICGVLRRSTPRGRLIVVDDGSSDRTGAVLERLRRDYAELIVETHPSNRGYGAALRTGVLSAQRQGFEYALFMDADLTTDPRYIPDFIEKMREGRDVIKATRYSKGGGMSGVPLRRAIISRAGNFIARRLFRLPITDCTNGFRAVKVPLLARMPLREPGFAVIMEELYYATALAKTYAEIPYILTSRDPDQGVSRFLYKPRVFALYLKYALLSLMRTPRIG